MPYQVTTLAWDMRLCLCQRWISSERHRWWFQKQLIYLRKHFLPCDHWDDRVHFLWQDRCSEKLYLQRLIAEISRVGSKFRLACCALVSFEKIVHSVMTGHGSRTVVDEITMTCVSGPCRSNRILASAYAVFYALSAGGSAFWDNYQNEKVLRQSLKNIC